MADIQKQLEAELTAFKETQKELRKIISTRQQLDAQLNENQVVKQELDLLPSERKVYKVVGPVLIKTEIIEAKQNVSKRMDYINKEIKRLEDLIGSLEKKQDTHREALQKFQQHFQPANAKLSLKS